MPTKEQEKAIESRKKQVIVTASAGAGKTTTMVSRVIDLILKDNVKLSSVVMLTFADAAAEEMKSRLAVSLIERIKTAGGEERRKLVDALDGLPLLHCSTIDSFCYSLVKTHFEFLGLPPTITLIDEETADSYRQKAIKNTLDAFAKEHIGGESEESYYGFLRSFGKEEDGELESCLLSLYDYAETTEDGDAFLMRAKDWATGPVDEHPAILQLLSAVRKRARAALEKIEAFGFTPPDGALQMRENYQKMVGFFRALASCNSLKILTETVQGADGFRPAIDSPAEKKEKEALAAFKEVAAAYKELKKQVIPLKDGEKLLKKEYSEIVSRISSVASDVVTLVDLTERFKENYKKIKEEEEVLDFADVEHCALTLLTKDATVAAEIGCTHLMMDESQDLNRLQEALMRAIVRGGNLFIVGDVKQSIFRFRLADPELFRTRVEEGKQDSENAAVISFDENFRSSDAVIEFVNLVFGNLMTEEFGGVNYPPANRGERHEGSGKVECFFYAKKEEGEEQPEKAPASEVYSVRKATEQKEDVTDGEDKEAQWVRDRILELVRPAVGKTVLRTTKDNKEFTVSYKDIAILSQVRMKRDSLQEKVVSRLREAGIPVNVGGFVKDAENTDVESLVDFLRLIVSPQNDYALLSVLRSDLFSFSVDELARIALTEGESFSRRAECAAESFPKLKEFYEYLAKCRFLSSSFSLYELVSLVIDERFRLTVPRRADGRTAMGQILAFAQTLKSGKATDSIPEYLNFFDNYYKMELEGEIAERDAVSIMTMHKSKGLEFPIVFVIGLGRTIINMSEYKSVVRMDNDFGVCKKTVGAEKEVLFNLFLQKKEKELKEDFLRLLYVAFTRAKNYLFVSGSVPKESDLIDIKAKEAAKYGSQLLLSGLNGCKTYIKEYSARPLTAPQSEVAAATVSGKAEVASSAALLRSAMAYRYPHEKATKTGIKFTVTAINAMKEEGAVPATKFFPEEDVIKGTAYHAVMENIPFDIASEREAASWLCRFAESGVITAEEAKDISAKRLVAGVKKVAELIGDRAEYREKSFLLHLPACEAGVQDIEDEVEVQGKIDLLALGKEDAVIIDYKLSAHTREELIKTYQAQLSLYALAVQKSFGVKHIRKYIFVLGRNEVIEL